VELRSALVHIRYVGRHIYEQSALGEVDDSKIDVFNFSSKLTHEKDDFYV
jgi:hypothetical protein